MEDGLVRRKNERRSTDGSHPAVGTQTGTEETPLALGADSDVERVLSDEVSPDGSEPIDKLFERIDRAEISRLLALDLCVGDPWHSSGVHNQFWYEDPSSGVLHPIAWDLRMLDLDHPPADSRFNRFWRAALREPMAIQYARRLIAVLFICDIGVVWQVNLEAPINGLNARAKS